MNEMFHIINKAIVQKQEIKIVDCNDELIAKSTMSYVTPYYVTYWLDTTLKISEEHIHCVTTYKLGLTQIKLNISEGELILFSQKIDLSKKYDQLLLTISLQTGYHCTLYNSENEKLITGNLWFDVDYWHIGDKKIDLLSIEAIHLVTENLSIHCDIYLM